MHEDLIAELRRGSFNHEHDAAMHAAADALEAMQLRPQAARGALADISVSADMKLHLARRKAGRVYIETAPPEEADPV